MCAPELHDWMQYEMERPVVYVSASCKHSRHLVALMERTGFADSYAFVNVDTEPRLPKFVDRVPLLYDGVTVVTDEDLFEMFSDASAAVAQPSNGNPSQIEPADTLCGSAFETAYDTVATAGHVHKRDSCWRLDEPHEKIATPECQPMPERDRKSE